MLYLFLSILILVLLIEFTNAYTRQLSVEKPWGRFLKSFSHNKSNSTFSLIKRKGNIVAKVQYDKTMDGAEPSYTQTMIAGAISRSLAQTMMHPLYTYKTLLQLNSQNHFDISKNVGRLFHGVDAQLLFSLPHGAIQFLVMDHVRIYYFYLFFMLITRRSNMLSGGSFQRVSLS